MSAALTIRAATPDDLDHLRPRLGRGLALLAEHHGVAVAAIALTSGRVASASPARPPTPSTNCAGAATGSCATAARSASPRRCCAAGAAS